MVQMDGKEGKAMDTNMGGSPGYWNQSQLLGNSPNEEVRGHWTPAGCGLKDIQYKKYINKVVSQAALKKLQNHMWYLGSEMAPLSLFSSKVCDKEKKSIVGAMILSGDDCNVRGIKCPMAECDELENKQVHELVTSSRAALRSL